VLKVSYLSSGQSRNCILQLFLVFWSFFFLLRGFQDLFDLGKEIELFL
jgi:hypothetical protein